MNDIYPTKDAVAKAQGQAFTAAVELMGSEAAHTQTTIGDYIITVACEEAEGMYEPDGEGDLKWHPPAKGDNQHVEVVVQDAHDRRFIPGLEIVCRVIALDGDEVGEKKQPFLWHPFLYHYGANWQIPKEGEYMFDLDIKRPAFMRHDEVHGERYKADVSVQLGPLSLEPGIKPHGSE